MAEQPASDSIISIHAAREGGDGYGGAKGFNSAISIHAAREGGDVSYIVLLNRPQAISIHAAREGGDCNAALAFGGFPISIHAAREGGDAFEFPDGTRM